jgi:flagellar export protein FliJ
VSARKQRIERIVRLRDEKLKQAVFSLETARAHEREADTALEAARKGFRQAEDSRRTMGDKGADVSTFIEIQNWLNSRSVEVELSERRQARARLVVEQCQREVADARNKLKQLEHLQLRLATQHRNELRRKERVSDDEIAQRVAGRSK